MNWLYQGKKKTRLLWSQIRGATRLTDGTARHLTWGKQSDIHQIRHMCPVKNSLY